jgi:hypothetical protein
MAKGQRKWGVVALNRDVVLERVQAGEKLTDIAQSLGLKTHAAIARAFRDDPEYQEARLVGVEARMEMRERELEVADESVTVARARDLLSHARWRAEREFPERWGQHNQVTVNKGIDLGERLRRAKERTIDGERVDVGATMGATTQLPDDNTIDNQ